jgi:hypothetical protein
MDTIGAAGPRKALKRALVFAAIFIRVTRI